MDRIGAPAGAMTWADTATEGAAEGAMRRAREAAEAAERARRAAEALRSGGAR
ncbi:MULTISPECIES: hypothetical protein [Terrabacteria group]